MKSAFLGLLLVLAFGRADAAVFGLLLLPTSLAPAFYVATAAGGGSDTNDGLAATVGGGHGPFATLGKCQTAMQASGTNKTCYVRGGTYTSLPSVAVGTYTAALHLTSSDNGETWSYYPADGGPAGGNPATFDGGSTVTNPGVMGTETCAAFYNCTPSAGSQDCSGGIWIGLRIDGGSNITLTGFELRNFLRGGIDSVYIAMRAPVGMQRFAPRIGAHGSMSSGRMRARRAEGSGQGHDELYPQR